MNSDYAVRSHIPLQSGTTFVETGHLTLDNPAQSVMTDFRSRPPVTITSDVTVDDALDKMKLAGVHLLLVSNPATEIIGIISSKDIMGERPVRVSQEEGIQHSKITVAMIMTPIGDIEALDMRSVRDARVGHIVSTLRDLNRQHTLVVEVDEEDKQQIRGMFSTTQISRQLGFEIAAPQQAVNTFADMVREIG